MPITVGLVKELFFVSEMLKTPIDVLIQTNRTKLPLKISVRDAILNIWYSENHIWNESLSEGITMFGIESVSTIFEIVMLIDNGAPWKHLMYQEK